MTCIYERNVSVYMSLTCQILDEILFFLVFGVYDSCCILYASTHEEHYRRLICFLRAFLTILDY